MTDADIRAITDKMNATPRKCLGLKTPAKVFAKNMVEVTGRQSYLRNQPKSHFMYF